MTIEKDCNDFIMLLKLDKILLLFWRFPQFSNIRFEFLQTTRPNSRTWRLQILNSCYDYPLSLLRFCLIANYFSFFKGNIKMQQQLCAFRWIEKKWDNILRITSNHRPKRYQRTFNNSDNATRHREGTWHGWETIWLPAMR